MRQGSDHEVEDVIFERDGLQLPLDATALHLLSAWNLSKAAAHEWI